MSDAESGAGAAGHANQAEVGAPFIRGSSTNPHAAR